MANIRCDFKSNALEMNTSMTVILPEDVDINKANVVYLFHGLEDNCTGWSRYTSIERYARKYQLVVVMPEVQRSFYSDMKFGIKYFEYIHDELPKIANKFFSISNDSDLTYIMGLSMGGYATLKCMLNTPERYAGCAIFSAAVDIENRAKKDIFREEFKALFGENLDIPLNSNIYGMLEKNTYKRFPKIYISCGEEDDLYYETIKTFNLLKEKGACPCFEHWTGIHDWEFWDESVKRAIEYMFND